MNEVRPHHVVMEVSRNRFDSKLREIEAWLAEWEIDAEIGSVFGSSGLLRVRFADANAAYAFRRCFAAHLPAFSELPVAQEADAMDEDLYESLGREYPE